MRVNQCRSRCRVHRYSQRVRGLSVLELLVGLAIGMLVVIAGLSALLAVRGVSGTVSEANALQLQASYALRIIGQQIRQVGGRMLQPADDPMAFAVFDEHPGLRSYLPLQGKETLASNEFALEVLYQNTAEKSLPLLNNQPQLQPLLRDCLGEMVDPSSTPVVMSRFRREGQQLVCAGSGSRQVLISGVEDFQVRYLLQTAATNSPAAWRYVRADQISTAAQWRQVGQDAKADGYGEAGFIDNQMFWRTPPDN